MTTGVHRRLSREESRAQTKERLLSAAFEIFVKEGIEAGSIEDVAEKAGYSRGAFYSNFASKEDLVLAVLEDKSLEVEREMSRMLSTPGTEMEVAERIRSYFVSLVTDNDHCVFWLAVKLYALRTPSVLPRVIELEQQDHQRMIGYVKSAYAAINRIPPVDPETVAYGLKSVLMGMGLQRSLQFKPNSPAQMDTMVRTIFDHISGLA